MKQKLLLFIMLCLAIGTNAQQRTQLRGNIINSQTKEPVAGVSVTILGQNQKEITDSNGEFFFPSVVSGDFTLLLEAAFIRSREATLTIGTDAVTLLKDVPVVVTEAPENLALVGIMDEALLDDDASGGASQEISSMVILSNDVYLSNVGYQLSPFRFKVRGYDSYHEQKFINGVNFNDQVRGVFNYSGIGALNDLTRNGDVINYYNPGSFTFGSIGGAENLNMRAGSYAKGGKMTLSYTNKNYYLRGMASYSTGLMDDGWAITVGLGGRYADEGNVDGTFYKNISYMFGIEKQWEEGRHSFSFTTFGSPVERGQSHASYQEAYDLTGDNLYNPDWGYQNGKKRNSRVVKAFDPTAIASHIWKINEQSTLTTGLGAHYNRYGGTALNWYNGPDPRPDYYRNLPSFRRDNLEVYNKYLELWEDNDKSITQIDWDNLYLQNHLSNREGKGAIYMVEERRSDLYEATFNSTLNTVISPNMKLNAGVGLRTSLSKQFKTVDDLLGAQYVLDIDKFAEQDTPGDIFALQNDLNRPNRKVYKDDTFGYDFDLRVHSANVWFQNEYTYQKFDFYYGTKLTYTEFNRKGHMQNGRYPDSSYGKGKVHNFVDYTLKAGMVYKFNGRHFLTANLSYGTQSPLPNYAYVSPRITDKVAKELESSRILSMDVNYIFSMPRINGRISAYRTLFFDEMDRTSYYHDSQRTYINHVLTGVNKINQGIELGLNYKLDNNWSFDLAGTVAEYYYSSNPMGIMNSENGKIDGVEEKVFLKGYQVGGAPQVAGTIGVNYFYDYWFLGLNLNGVSRNYVEIAPIRRMVSNYQFTPGQVGVDPNNSSDMEAFNALTNQERFGSSYTIDLSIGKMFYLKNRKSINFNFAVNNILNRKNVKTGGYESGRMNLSYPDRYATKYYYMQGINCFLNASYRF